MRVLSVWAKMSLCMRLLINQLATGLLLCSFLVSVLTHSAVAAGPATTAHEKALWTVWKLHQREPYEHDSVVAACRHMRNTSPANPMLIVSRGIAGWHLLQAGKTNEAVRVLNAMVSYNRAALPVSGTEMARRWLTRIDRDLVKSALNDVYKQQIQYPETLAVLKRLPKGSVPPLTDQWKTPWDYRLIEFKRIKGLKNQRYVLQSQRLRADSDLHEALARPYASDAVIRPVSVSRAMDGRESIMFETFGDKSQKVLLSEGTTFQGIRVAYLGVQLLILSDGDYWLVMPKPRQ